MPTEHIEGQRGTMVKTPSFIDFLHLSRSEQFFSMIENPKDAGFSIAWKEVYMFVNICVCTSF